MKKLIYFAGLATLLVACQNQDLGGNKSPNGKFVYNLFPAEQNSDKPNIQVGDQVTLHYTLRKGNQLILSSTEQGNPVELSIPDKMYRNQFEEPLLLAKEGDSLEVQIAYQDAEQELSSFKEHFKKGDKATFTYRILKVIPRAELEYKRQVAYALKKGFANVDSMFAEQERVQTAAPILRDSLVSWLGQYQKNKLQLEKSADGLAYKILHKEQGPLIQSKDSVRLYYIAMIQEDARVFDDAFKRGDRFEMQVDVSKLPVMFHHAVKLLRKGEKAYFFIPTELGYGAKGSLPIVPVNANLLLYIEVVDVKTPLK